VDEAGDPLCEDHYHVRPITPWLLESLRANKPYDLFVRELVNPPDLPRDPYADTAAFRKLPRDSSGFLQGIRMGGAEPTAIQSVELQAAQNIGQVFLGIPLKCATCHDSFIDGWKQREVWALASVYSEKALEIHRAELPTGQHAPAAFLFPELDRIQPDAPVRERVAQLAESLTAPENGLLARTLVNRIWAQLNGRGIVGQLDDMAEPAWHPELLDWLAADFIAHGYDIQHVLRRIMTSRAWQMPADLSVPVPGREYIYRGPQVRRLGAEQFLDTLYVLQGRGYRAWEQQSSALADALGRPDRQIVVTSRDDAATVLQSLKLQNGRAFRALLYQHEPPSLPRPSINDRCPVTNRRLGVNPRQKHEVLLHEGWPIGFVDASSASAFTNNPALYLPKLEKDIHVARVGLNRPAPIPPGTDLLRLAADRFTHALSRPPNPAEVEIMRRVFGSNPTLDDLAHENAYRLLKSPAARAFDLEQEPDEVRAAYDTGGFGRGCLLARRLVEAGSRFVEVHVAFDNAQGWDHHDSGHTAIAGMKKLVDRPVAQLVRDLETRGLLDTTLVILASEFGRACLSARNAKPTPVRGMGNFGLNNHHGGAGICLFWGGGFRRGMLYGETESAFPCSVRRNPVFIEDLHATIYTALGISPQHYFEVERRPFYVTQDGRGEPIAELLG
jgi:hypothetical protein